MLFVQVGDFDGVFGGGGDGLKGCLEERGWWKAEDVETLISRPRSSRIAVQFAIWFI